MAIAVICNTPIAVIYEVGGIMRLKQRREELGFSQQRLALLSGVSQTAISNYEVGDREMGSVALVSLATALECSTDYLIGLTDEPGIVRPSSGLTTHEQAIVNALRANDRLEAIRLIVKGE